MVALLGAQLGSASDRPDPRVPWHSSPSPGRWQPTPVGDIRYPKGAITQDLSPDRRFQAYWWPAGATIPFQYRELNWMAVVIAGELALDLPVGDQQEQRLSPDTLCQVQPYMPHSLQCVTETGCEMVTWQAGMRNRAHRVERPTDPRELQESYRPPVLRLVSNGWLPFRSEPQLQVLDFHSWHPYFGTRASEVYRVAEGATVHVRTAEHSDTGLVISGSSRVVGKGADFSTLTRGSLFSVSAGSYYSWECLSGPCAVLHPNLADPHITDLVPRER